MGLLDWLLGRRRADSDTPYDEMTPMGGRRDVQAPRDPQAAAAPTAALPPVGSVAISYRMEKRPIRRVVRPLFCTPGFLLTTIDQTIRRVRTYRIDQIAEMTDHRGQNWDALEFLATNHPGMHSDLQCADDGRRLAMTMRKAMFAQAALVVLMARAADGDHAQKAAMLMRYLKRDNLFEVRQGWVRTGRKADAWPVLTQMLFQADIGDEDVEAIVGTLKETEAWGNQRRLDALGAALTEMANLGGTPPPRAIAFGNRVMRLFR